MYVSLGNNFLLFLWRPLSCGGPGQLPSLPPPLNPALPSNGHFSSRVRELLLMTSSFEFDFNSVKLPTREIFCLPTCIQQPCWGGAIYGVRPTRVHRLMTSVTDRQTDRRVSAAARSHALKDRACMIARRL